MGKASKWIRSFLLGKKDEKCKKINRLLPAESLGTPQDFLSSSDPKEKRRWIGTPQVILSSSARKEKRRWSFKRLGNADATIVTHKRNASFDSSFSNTQLVKQALLDCEVEQIRGILMGNTSAGAVVKTASPATFPDTGIANAAATKIQAMFRSYLARRALRALRGLVKIQALVRGYLVRKKTSMTIRCMHALMAIQIRARVQRVQITDEAQTVGKRGSILRESSKDYQFIAAYNDKMNLKMNEPEGVSKRETGDMNELRVAETEDEFNFNMGIPGGSCTGLPFMHHSGRHSISKDEHFQQICRSPSTAFTNYNRQVVEFSVNTPHRISQHNSRVSKPKQTRGPFSLPCSENSNSTLWDYRFAPTYMSKTESSKAKARSKSEPRQRPKWEIKQKSKLGTSIESMNVNHAEQEKQHPWLIKLHQAARSSVDSRCSSTRTILNSSSCRNLNATQLINSS